jgi:hypothetical protein
MILFLKNKKKKKIIKTNQHRLIKIKTRTKKYIPLATKGLLFNR